MQSRKHAQTRPSPVAVGLLLIDVITKFRFPDGNAILKQAVSMRDALVRMKTRARDAGLPVIYVNLPWSSAGRVDCKSFKGQIPFEDKFSPL